MIPHSTANFIDRQTVIEKKRDNKYIRKYNPVRATSKSVRAAHVVISAYTRRKEKRKPVTQAFSYLKDCTYKEGSKNVTQDKGVKLSIAQDRQCDQ